MQKSRRRLSFLLAGPVFCAAALLSPVAAAQEASVPETLTPGSFVAYAADGMEPRLSDFSGLPVPRYASLRFNEVNGRSGPSPDYPVRWTYERAGLPVVVVRESKDWRKVRDPMGDEVWINKSQLNEQRTAIRSRKPRWRRGSSPVRWCRWARVATCGARSMHRARRAGSCASTCGGPTRFPRPRMRRPVIAREIPSFCAVARAA